MLSACNLLTALLTLAWRLRCSRLECSSSKTTREPCPITCFTDNCQCLQGMDSLKAQLAAVQDPHAMTAAQQPMKSPLWSPFSSPITRANSALLNSSSVQVCTPTDTLPAVLASIPLKCEQGWCCPLLRHADRPAVSVLGGVETGAHTPCSSVSLKCVLVRVTFWGGTLLETCYLANEVMTLF